MRVHGGDVHVCTGGQNHVQRRRWRTMAACGLESIAEPLKPQPWRSIEARHSGRDPPSTHLCAGMIVVYYDLQCATCGS